MCFSVLLCIAIEWEIPLVRKRWLMCFCKGAVPYRSVSRMG